MQVYKDNMEKYKGIDFSSVHNVMIRNFDGCVMHMDDPYYEVRRIDEGTWQILSDGDFFYLLDGGEEGMCIDTGYGCGNVRRFCEDLLGKPVRTVANSHDHWDHVCNNSYFDLAYMSPLCHETILAGNVMPSFGDVQFPRDYPVQTVEAGDVIPLKGRELEVFAFADHALSSRCYLDRKHRIFFMGDELSDWSKGLRNITVAEFAKQMETMWALEEYYDICCSGTQIFHKSYVLGYLLNARHILSGAPGKPVPEFSPKRPGKAGQVYDEQGRILYIRRGHRFPDSAKGRKREATDRVEKLLSEFAGTRIIYAPDKIY